MDNDKVFVEEFEVGTLVEVDVEDLAVATPVAAEIEDDAFVFEAGLFEGSGDVAFGIGLCGVEMLLDGGHWRHGLACGWRR
jgi:hypothetical protein